MTDSPNRSYVWRGHRVRFTFTRLVWPGHWHGVIKEIGTDAWLFECTHPHTSRSEAMNCVHRQSEGVAETRREARERAAVSGN